MSTPRRRAVLNALANLPIFASTQRGGMLRRAGVVLGDDVEIEQGLRVAGGGSLQIGDSCYLGFDLFIDCEGGVVIGKGTAIAQGARIISSGHEVLPVETGKIVGPTTPAPVTIGEQVWIGAGAIILPGITIADYCVIGAGAVVTRDTASGGVYAGVPARRIKEISAVSPAPVGIAAA
jgi:maltose O-acetyltransferase